MQRVKRAATFAALLCAGASPAAFAQEGYAAREDAWRSTQIAERREADEREFGLLAQIGGLNSRVRRQEAEIAQLTAQLQQSQDADERRIGDLLREGRVPEALDAIEAIARARSGDDAALWWRRLALLAAGDYPQRAANANRRALALAPDDFESIAAVADDLIAERSAQSVAEGEALARRALAFATDAGQRARVYAMLASGAEWRGDLAGALSFAEQAAAAQAEFALAGDDLVARGHYCAARWDVARIRAERVNASSPQPEAAGAAELTACGREMLRRFGEDGDRLLLSLGLMGTLVFTQHSGAPQDLAAFERTLSEAESLINVVADPELTPWARRVRYMLELSRAGHYRRAQRLDDALAALHRSAALAREQVAAHERGEGAPASLGALSGFLGENPSLADAQEDVALSHVMLARVLFEQSRFAEGDAEIEAALAQLRTLAARLSTPRIESRLAKTHMQYAVALATHSRFAEAARHREDALAIARRLHTERGDLMYVSFDLFEDAAATFDADVPAENARAIAVLQEGVALIRATRDRGGLGYSDHGLARALSALGLRQRAAGVDALPALREAAALWTNGNGLDPHDWRPGETHLALSEVLGASGDFAGAQRACDAAVNLLRNAVAAGEQNAHASLYNGLECQRETRLRLNNPADALPFAEAAAQAAREGEAIVGGAITLRDRLAFAYSHASYAGLLLHTLPQDPMTGFYGVSAHPHEAVFARAEAAFGEARRLAAAAVAADRRNPVARFALADALEGIGAVYWRRGDGRTQARYFREAVEAFDQCLRLDSDPQRRANVERRRDTLREALRDLR